MNIHWYPILHGCMDTQKGRYNINDIGIILDSGCSSTIVMIRLI